MAISAVLYFQSDGDPLKTYDAVVDDMGIRDNPAKGGVYHWCAAEGDGLRVCDVWESREDFEHFAREQIAPLGAKHGYGAPSVEIADVHEMIPGRLTGRGGMGLILEVDGDTKDLLAKIDEVNQKINALENPPEGLIFHWTAPTSRGIRVCDHWRSRADFDAFIETRLGAALKSAGVPQPRMQFYEVHNTIDKRVAAAV